MMFVEKKVVLHRLESYLETDDVGLNGIWKAADKY